MDWKKKYVTRGKVMYSPYNHYLDLVEISWFEDMVPELIWLILLNDQIEIESSVKILQKMSLYFKDTRNFQFLISDFINLSPETHIEFKNYALKNQFIGQISDVFGLLGIVYEIQNLYTYLDTARVAITKYSSINKLDKIVNNSSNRNS